MEWAGTETASVNSAVACWNRVRQPEVRAGSSLQCRAASARRCAGGDPPAPSSTRPADLHSAISETRLAYVQLPPDLSDLRGMDSARRGWNLSHTEINRLTPFVGKGIFERLPQFHENIHFLTPRHLASSPFSDHCQQFARLPESEFISVHLRFQMPFSGSLCLCGEFVFSPLQCQPKKGGLRAG